MLNDALVIEIVSNSFSESKKASVDKARNVLIEKKMRYGMKDIFPLDFIKYLSCLQVEKNSKVVNV